MAEGSDKWLAGRVPLCRLVEHQHGLVGGAREEDERAERGKDNGWQKTRGLEATCLVTVNIGPSSRVTPRT